LLTNSDNDVKIDPFKLGKKIELKYIPFSELAIPWNVVLDETNAKQSRLLNFRQTTPKNSKASRILRSSDIEALKRSISQYGLLKPFEVAEIYERLDFFFGKGKYLVIDGQRRYFAIRELLKIPTENDESKRKESLRTDSEHETIVEGEMQAQKHFDMLNIRDYVLVPCIVYPYTTLLQMIRHSIEDKKFSEKPTKQDFELASKMAEQGIIDLYSDDLRELWKTRSKIEEERKSIESTLEEIRTRIVAQKNDEAGSGAEARGNEA